MMNNKCIDIDYSQVYKDGQVIGGDVFLLNRNDERNKIVATLSDGLGSGVKANVLASLTANMCQKLSVAPIDIVHSAEIIMDTLPVDSDRGISYSTFTVAHMKYTEVKDNIQVQLVEYDNPPALRFRGSYPLDWDKNAHKLNRKTAIKDEIVYHSEFNMEKGDRLIYFSDGVAQAGIGLGPGIARSEEVSAKGWGLESVTEFIIKEIEKNPEISSRDLARSIVTQALSYDDFHANDDITCTVIYIREPRRTLVVTGAPRKRDMDPELAKAIRNHKGPVIVCGGTTASIVARELGTSIKPDSSPSGNLPPSSHIDGCDLVTEGMITLTEVADRLDHRALLKHMPVDAAKRFIQIMRVTDQVEFLVGTKISNATEDNPVLANFGIRIPLVSRIRKILEEKYLIETDIRYL